MSEELNRPSETSIGNSLASSEYTTEGYESAPEWRDFSNLSMQPTGEQQDLSFLEEPYNPSWPESRKNRWEEYNFGGVATTPAGAAKRTLEEMDGDRRRAAEMMSEQRKAEMQGATPAARAELASAQADAAAKQAEVQEAYRQEVEYQRSLTTLNNDKATGAEKRAARMQIEALSAGIGKRINPKLGTSAAAMSEAKNAVGYIGAYEYKNPLADFGSRISTMQRNSEERLGLLRQQMEASGVLVPEAAPAPAAPDQAQMVLERFSVKAPDGNPVMFNGFPVVTFKRAGKDVVARQRPNGNFVELTAEEAAALLGQ
jgi:hypothetical protein